MKMKNGVLIAIAVFGVSVIGAVIAAAAYFKHKESMIFDEYDLDYYKEPAEKAGKNTKSNETACTKAEEPGKTDAGEKGTTEECCCGCEDDEDVSDEIDFASDEEETAEPEKK